jgi:pimeloyl-ACP methyl ester carboxylesterase
MKKGMLLTASGAGAALIVDRLFHRYRVDLDAAYARLAAMQPTVLSTRFGAVEYLERGTGQPVLSIHGSFGGYDAGLAVLRGLIPPDRRVVAPSRFGYLGSDMPPRAGPAEQADAFAALLDDIGIARTDVIAISSGATSAIQLALRHPDRVTHLVVISGNLPGAADVVTPPQAARLVYQDAIVWMLKVFARPVLLRQIGIPRGYTLEAPDERIVADVLDGLFPVAPRVEGVMSDAFVFDPEVHKYQLEALAVPTMIVHAKDDPLVAYDVAERAAERVRGAQLLTVERGGHLMLGGHGEMIARSVLAFLTAYSHAADAGPGSGSR